MKKLLVLLLALTLCLPAFAEGGAGITLVPAGNFSPYADFEDDCARVIDTGDTGLEGVFDIQGNAVIPCEYGSVSDYGVCSYYTVQNENGTNVLGALNAAGELVVPMEYGDIEFLSEKWAMAVKLEVTDTEPYDYQALFGDENYIVTAYDFYDLESAAMAGTLGREDVNSAKAYGDYLFIEDRDGVVTIYDAALTAVGNAESLYEAYGNSDEGVVSLATGDVVVPGYGFSSDLGAGRLAVYDENYDDGIADLEGNMLAPCGEYDYIYEYDLNGYARVEKDGKYGLIDLNGQLVVPCEYDGFESLNYGGDYVYGLNGYACVEQDGKYGYVSLATGEVTCPVNYASPTIIGLSMIVPDITGELYIIAADGTATPTAYAEFYEYPSGDGTLLKAMTAEEMWGIVDWHGNVVLDFTFDYASAVLIAPDATALLVDTDEGMAGYTIEGGLAAAPVSAADATDAESVAETAAEEAPAAEEAADAADAEPSEAGEQLLTGLQELLGM